MLALQHYWSAPESSLTHSFRSFAYCYYCGTAFCMTRKGEGRRLGILVNAILDLVVKQCEVLGANRKRTAALYNGEYRDFYAQFDNRRWIGVILIYCWVRRLFYQSDYAFTVTPPYWKKKRNWLDNRPTYKTLNEEQTSAVAWKYKSVVFYVVADAGHWIKPVIASTAIRGEDWHGREQP